MHISSIYEHMTQACEGISEKENVKIVLRHSIRQRIKSKGSGLDVALTDEGKALAYHFGKSCKENIGFLGASDAFRCIQTLQCISQSANLNVEIKPLKEELRKPHVLESKLCGKSFTELPSYQIIYNLKNDIEVPGLRTLRDSVKIMLDGIFSYGNKPGSFDLYCTHDFQIALLVSALFDFGKKINDFEKEPWPMMFEGIVFSGTRECFNASWRGNSKRFVNYLF